MRTRRLAVVVRFYSGCGSCASCASATATATAIVSGCVVVISASITGCGMIWLSLLRRWRRRRRQQHKQDVNNLLKKLPLPLLVLLLVAESWGVCGDSVVVVVVTRDSCIDAASSSSICSVVINLLNASVWSLLNSIMDSIRFLTTPVSMSVCK